MKMQWEYDLVEKPFCRQLQAMGWEWLEGDPDLPESTERSSSHEVLLKNRLAAALRRINLRDGRPWREFRYDQAARRITVKTGGDPRLHTFEIVLREQGIDLSGRKGTKIEGITVVDTLRANAANP